MEWDMEGPDADPMEDFQISPLRGSASRSRREAEEEEYMEGLRREVLGGAKLEEPRRSRLHFEEETDVAAGGTHGVRRWEPGLTSRPAFVVCKAENAAVSEDLKNIRPPMYNANSLIPNRLKNEEKDAQPEKTNGKIVFF